MSNIDMSILNQSKDSLSVFSNKPFWIWDYSEHETKYLESIGQCCFNHILSLPTKGAKQYPLFNFQQIIFDTIEQNKNVWIKKARGIGFTTLMLRYISWKILSSTELDYKSIYIISAGNGNSSEDVTSKFKNLFEKKFPLIKLGSKFTDYWLRNTWIKILSNINFKDIDVHDTSYVIIDEADYLDGSGQTILEQEFLHPDNKSNCKVIMASTPNRTGGLFEKIENERNSSYVKLKLDYSCGLGTIYNESFIQEKKLDPEFEREYNLKY